MYISNSKMPTYTCINFYISRSSVTDNLVRDFYEAIQIKDVYATPCAENLSLEEVIVLNQKELDPSCRLDSNQHFANRTAQIKLLGTPYDECRVYIYEDYPDGDIGFRMIVPDTDVLQHGYDLLKEIAKSVANKIPVEDISTFDEIGYKTATVELSDGEDMGVQYFGYTKDEAVLKNKYFKYTLLNGGYFIEYSSS